MAVCARCDRTKRPDEKFRRIQRGAHRKLVCQECWHALNAETAAQSAADDVIDEDDHAPGDVNGNRIEAAGDAALVNAPVLDDDDDDVDDIVIDDATDDAIDDAIDESVDDSVDDSIGVAAVVDYDDIPEPPGNPLMSYPEPPPYESDDGRTAERDHTVPPPRRLLRKNRRGLTPALSSTARTRRDR